MKSIFQSKTFWANVLGIAVMFANVLPPKYSGMALAAINIALRTVTTEPVTLK